MRISVLKAQICGATLTDANLEYIGSITIDADHLKSSGILPNEQVRVWNNTTGTRLTTYALEGPAGSGVFCINGAGAHLFSVGDNITVSAFVEMEEIPAGYRPQIISICGGKNGREKKVFPERIHQSDSASAVPVAGCQQSRDLCRAGRP